MEETARHPEQVANHYRKQMCFSLLSEILKEEVRQHVEQYCQRLPSMVMHDYFFATKRKTYGPSTSSEPNCKTSVTTEEKFIIKLDTSNFAMNELLVRPLNGQFVITGKHYISKLDCYEFFEMKRCFDIPKNVDINTARGYRTAKGILVIEAAYKSEPAKAIKIEEDPCSRTETKVFKRRNSVDVPPKPTKNNTDTDVPNGKEPSLFSFMTREIPFTETNEKKQVHLPPNKKKSVSNIFPPESESINHMSSGEDHVSPQIAKAAHSFLSVLLSDKPGFLISPKVKELVTSMTHRNKTTSPNMDEPILPILPENEHFSLLTTKAEHDFPLAHDTNESISDEAYGEIISPKRENMSSSASTSDENPTSITCLKIPHYPIQTIKSENAYFRRYQPPKRTRTPEPTIVSLSDKEFASTSSSSKKQAKSTIKIHSKRAKTSKHNSSASPEKHKLLSFETPIENPG